MTVRDELRRAVRTRSGASRGRPRAARAPVAGRLARRGALLPAARPLQRRRGRTRGRCSTAPNLGARPAGARRGDDVALGPLGAVRGGRWQGGTLARHHVEARLPRSSLGVTALWVGPVFKQRGHLDTYHGYGIQDFLDVDPRFGTRDDLVDLVAAAHAARPARHPRHHLQPLRARTGSTGPTAGGEPAATCPGRGFYPFGAWLDARRRADRPRSRGRDDGRLAGASFRTHDRYTRAGRGRPRRRRHRRSARRAQAHRLRRHLRDFNFDAPGRARSDDLARCYKYWIALTDCDGFRIDTLKHVSFEQARNFCGAIKEFAANLGKARLLPGRRGRRRRLRRGAATSTCSGAT